MTSQLWGYKQELMKTATEYVSLGMCILKRATKVGDGDFV